MTLRCWSLVSRPWHYQRNPNISNYPFLSFDIETNSMRKCLLKLFSLLQKKSSSHHHSNILISEERIDLSKYPPACLPEHGQQLKVNTSAFVYGGYWLSSTIDGNMTQFKTKNANFFWQQWEQYTGWGKRGEAYSATILQKTEVSNCVLSTGVHFRSLRRPSSTLQTMPLFEVLRWSLEIHILGLDSGGKKLHFRIYRRHIWWTIFSVCARWTFGNLRGEAPHSILGNLVQFCPNFLGEITIIWTGRQWRTTDSCGFWGKTHFGRRCQ